MADDFKYDVFLSHSSKDKDIVRAVAERLRADGLRVWFDSWELRPGDSIPAKIEEGLEHSRVLVLCMSANAFGSDWAQLEAGTFRFRDPLNRERRFIPLRLDAAPIKGSLAQFLYINWLPEEREQKYAKLLEACRPPQARPQEESVNSFALSVEKEKWPIGPYHLQAFKPIAFSPNGSLALLSIPFKIELREVNSGRRLYKFAGKDGEALSIAWSDDGHYALSGSVDKRVRLWEVKRGRCLRVLNGHADRVLSVAWSRDGLRAFSCTLDGVMLEWDMLEFVPETQTSNVQTSTSILLPEQVQYTNAKVLLVGDSGVGKTGLSNRLALDHFEETDSTDGAWQRIGPCPTPQTSMVWNAKSGCGISLGK